MNCYLCEKEIIQRPGQEFKLRCERGGPITVCEDCFEEADDSVPEMCPAKETAQSH